MQYVPAAADSNYPYVLWQQELAGGAKKMITLLHSIVCTARFWMSFQCGKPFDHQEAVIPPQCILGTDAVTVTKAILLALETRVFGRPIKEWLQAMRASKLQLLVFMISADYASANLKVIQLVKALVVLDFAAASGTFVWFWFERCGCHQLMRASVATGKQTGEKTAQRSKSKLLRMRRSRDNFKAQTLLQYERCFEFNGVRKTEEALQRRSTDVSRLTELVSIKISAAHFHQAAAGLDGDTDPTLVAFVNFLEFHNNSSPLDPHFSRSEPDPRVTKQDAIREGQRLLSIVLFSKGVPQWNEARMLRFMECQRFWAIYNIMIPCQATVWENFKTSKTQSERRSDGEPTTQEAKDGVRLARARVYAKDPRARALSILSYTALMHVESLFCLLFYMSGDSIDGNSVVRGGKLIAPQVPFSLSRHDVFDEAGELLPPPSAADGPAGPQAGNGAQKKNKKKVKQMKKKGMNYVVDGVEQFIGEMWSMLTQVGGAAIGAQQVGGAAIGENGVHKTLVFLQQLTHDFWPAGGEQECAEMISNVLSTLICEVSFRFLGHRFEPYSSCGIKGQAPTDGQIQRVFNTLRTSPCCLADVMALVDYSLAPDATGVSSADRYRIAHAQWNLRCEPTNIPREKLHAEQRFQSKKTDRHPTTYARQAATSVAAGVSRLQYFRGGRSLEVAPQDSCEAFKQSVGGGGRIKHSRPHSVGSPAWAWAQEQKEKASCVLLLLAAVVLFV